MSFRQNIAKGDKRRLQVGAAISAASSPSISLALPRRLNTAPSSSRTNQTNKRRTQLPLLHLPRSANLPSQSPPPSVADRVDDAGRREEIRMRAGATDADPPPGGVGGHGGEELLRDPEGDDCA
ncbi:hypothetical protein VPH35_137166 [Triticum aestivum]